MSECGVLQDTRMFDCIFFIRYVITYLALCRCSFPLHEDIVWIHNMQDEQEKG